MRLEFWLLGELRESEGAHYEVAESVSKLPGARCRAGRLSRGRVELSVAKVGETNAQPLDLAYLNML